MNTEQKKVFRGKSWQLLLLAMILYGSVFSQGFPGTDSLRNYNTRYITNNPNTAFTNLRLHTLLRGVIDWIDTARISGGGGGGSLGVDTIYAINDSTIRYRKSGVFRNVVIKGVYDSRRKVDSMYQVNDSTIGFLINGVARTFIVRGSPAWRLTGNSGTDPSNFIGTTDERPLRFRTNNVERVIIDSATGRVWVIDGPDTLALIAGSENIIRASAGTDLLFSTNDLTRMKITSSGFIGVGGVEPLEMLDVNGNINARDAFKIYNPAAGALQGELYHAGTYLGLRTITAHPLVIETDNTERSRYTADGYFNVSAKTNLLDTTTAPIMSNADSSNRVETTARTKRLIAALEAAIPLYTASGGMVKIGNDFRLGGALSGNTAIATAGYDLNLSGTGRLFVDTGRIVIGIPVDPLYPFSIKKIYDNVTQANFSTTVAKYPFYADKFVQFTEDSMSLWSVPGDNAGLFGLRYKARSVLNMENNVNRFTASHSVLFLEKYPGFGDTTIFYGRTSPLTGISPPTGFSAIVSQSQSGLSSTNPNIGKGWFSALSAEWQMGGTAFNKQENAIWLHTGILGAAAGAITNGYGLYINGFGSGVTNKYAIYQQGTLDTNYLAGKIRVPNLTSQTDTTLYKPSVMDANGNLFKLSYWPVGSGGGGSGTVTNFVFTDGNGFDGTVSTAATTPTLSLTTSLTTGSIPFIAAGGALSQNNTNLSWDNTNNRLSVAGQVVNIVDNDLIHRRVTNTNTMYGFVLQNSLSQDLGGIRSSNTGEVRIGSFRSTWFPTFYSNNTEVGRFTTAGLFAIGGGGTSSFPALKNNAGVMEIMKADNSGYTSLTSLGLTLSGLAGTGTRLSTVSSTGVSGAITNGTDGQVMTMVSGSPAWADKDFDGGSYTPTFSNLGTGVSGVTLPAGASIKWQRVKKTVTIWGNINPAFSSGATGDIRNWSMSLPPGITAVFTQNQDAAGIANCGWKVTRGAIVEADAANDLIGMSVEIGSEGFGATIGYYFTVSFQIP